MSLYLLQFHSLFPQGRLELNRSGAICLGVDRVAFLLVGKSALVIAIGYIRSEANNFAKVRDGAIKIALVVIDHTAIEVGPRRGFKTYTLAVVSNRALKIALFLVGETTVVIGHGEVWFELNRFIVINDSEVDFILIKISLPTVAVSEDVLWIQADSLRIGRVQELV
jgi:hypothetical protein